MPFWIRLLPQGCEMRSENTFLFYCKIYELGYMSFFVVVLHSWPPAKDLFISKRFRVPLPALLSHVMDCCCVELFLKSEARAPLVSEAWLWASWQSHLKASMSLSTFCASPWTRTWAWNFLRASSSSMPEKSISSTTQLLRDRQREKKRGSTERDWV